MTDAVFKVEDLREDIDLEAKRAAGKDGKGALPVDLWETYSAFANTDGGTIILGLSERKHRLIITGVEEPDKVLDDFWAQINNPQKPRTNGRMQQLCRLHPRDLTDPSMGSEHSGTRSEHLAASSEHLATSSAHSSVDDPTRDRELLRLAEPVRSTGKTNAETVRSTILELCSGRFLTLNQLATLLGRSPDGLRQRFVKSMVDGEKVLERRFPNQPNHEQQAYQTRQK